MIVVVMGVSGAGKTTIGRLLADQLGWEFLDADDLHSPENKRKMSHGVALSDEDRAPWLASVRDLIEKNIASDADAVIACSALKRSYREKIVVDPAKVKIVYLKGSRELIAQRIAQRRNHFMNNSLLDSQFDALEEPHDAITVNISGTPQAILASILEKLRL
ncbi:MAG TPA: gluconokinase [Candidatus Binataceae bacterium]|nr:gluconokinase [Candidatus Binataceae bacterium]